MPDKDENHADSLMPATYDVAVAPGGVSPSSPALGFPSLSSVVQAGIPTLQHIPKGARDSWAKVMFGILSSVQ